MATTTSQKPSAAIPGAADLVAFEHGAAGHQGISTDATGSLLIKPCTQAEIDFYQSAKDHPNFLAHMPMFMGSLSLNKDPAVEKLVKDTTDPAPASQDWVPSGGAKLTTSLAIVLSNAAAGFVRPNVLDVKLGARLWDDDAPLPKRAKLDEVANETTSSSLGFRVAGMKLWLGDDATDNSNSKASSTHEVNTKISADGWKTFDKFYGRTFQADTVKNAFSKYLGGGALRPKHSRVVAERLLREIQSIQYVLEHEESRMYSASILMVYEGDDAALEQKLKEEAEAKKKQKDKTEDAGDDAEEEDDDEDDEQQEQKIHDVCLIDFAHAHWTPGQGPDENALNGVRNVVRILEEILEP